MTRRARSCAGYARRRRRRTRRMRRRIEEIRKADLTGSSERSRRAAILKSINGDSPTSLIGSGTNPTQSLAETVGSRVRVSNADRITPSNRSTGAQPSSRGRSDRQEDAGRGSPKSGAKLLTVRKPGDPSARPAAESRSCNSLPKCLPRRSLLCHPRSVKCVDAGWRATPVVRFARPKETGVSARESADA